MDSERADQSRPWLAVGLELNEVLQQVDGTAFTSFADAARTHSGRWFFTGQGRSGLSAQMGAMRLMHLGREVHVLGDATSPSVRAGDALLVVSGSGTTPVSIGFASIAREQGALVFLVTASPESPLAALSDHVLVAPVTQSHQLMGTLFEQSALALLDAVASSIAEQEPQSRDGMAHRHTNMQ